MSYPQRRNWIVLMIVGAGLAVPAIACGPFFPNQLLFHAGQSAAWAPVADFRREIERIKPEASGPRAIVPEKDDPYRQSERVDLSDLREALEGAQVPQERRGTLLASYRGFRQRMTEHARRVADQKEKGADTQPVALDVTIPEGLPVEFAAYSRGLLCYYRRQMPQARAAWGALLQLPPEQRRYRTVWAQFMIGKSYLGSEGARAVEAFHRVRELVKQGLPDSLGLASASLGWEARADLDLRYYARAIALYMQQHASGDPTALESMAFVCGIIFSQNDSRVLGELANDPISARALTAYALSQGGPFRAQPDGGVVRRWLAAVESAGSGPMIGAERLAWSAYQQGDMAVAGRWLDQSPADAPIALWVRAKLLLRAGKLDAAAALFARAARAFPLDERWDGVSGTYEPREEFDGTGLSPRDRASAELGALQLSRGQYVDALDRLLNSGWWLDAAYVAERVLTANELIAYVDGHCPQGTQDNLRHLLARRLTRTGRWKDARGHFPPDLRPKLDAYIAAIRSGHDEALPASQRGEFLWAAAKIARKDGMDLLATELTPDDFADRGNFRGSDVAGERSKSRDPLLPTSADELRRVNASGPLPPRRWHYRYTAAEHAWAAAELLPDETDLLGLVLCEAGNWLKADDPKAADRFYKALTTRCRTTKLGQEAEKKKWLPDIHPANAESQSVGKEAR